MQITHGGQEPSGSPLSNDFAITTTMPPGRVTAHHPHVPKPWRGRAAARPTRGRRPIPSGTGGQREWDASPPPRPARHAGNPAGSPFIEGFPRSRVGPPDRPKWDRRAAEPAPADP